MEYISTTVLARNNNIVPADLFLVLSEKGYIVKEGKSWILTDKASSIRAKYRKNQKGEQWIVWPSDFNLNMLGDLIRIKAKSNNNISSDTTLGMMNIICLSNSYKEGGRCIAGIQVNDSLGALKTTNNKRPLWVRPVCDTEHEQIPNNIAAPFDYYDILKFIPDSKWYRKDYQSENLKIKNDSIQCIRKANPSLSILDDYCENDFFNNIFGSTGSFITEKAIKKLDYSLIMLKLNNFSVHSAQNQYSSYPKTRLKFKFKNNQYDFPVTDPKFLHHYRHNPKLLYNVNVIYVVFSLAVFFNEKYYKLVATILYE